MYSNLVKTNYEIKDMKLQDLRDRIIQENNLTPLEILKGFHEKSEVKLRYQSTLTEQEKKDTRTIEDEYINYIKNIDRKSIQQLYDKEFETRFQECKEECPEITLSDIIDYNNGKELPVLISNANNRLHRNLSNINEIIKRKIKDEATDYINKFINDNYGEKYKFALKTRFNFEIPLNIYGNFNRNELNILQLYDFGDELSKADKNIIMNTLNRHKYSVSDIKLLYDFIPQEAEKHNEYDKNMSEEIMFTIIEQVGSIRREIDNDIQNELSENLIIEIFEDNFIKKACLKKHLSTRTYVKNYFRDKGLYNRIIKILNERLINN